MIASLDITTNSSDIELFVRSKFEITEIESSLPEKKAQGLLACIKGV